MEAYADCPETGLLCNYKHKYYPASNISTSKFANKHKHEKNIWIIKHLHNARTGVNQQ